MSRIPWSLCSLLAAGLVSGCAGLPAAPPQGGSVGGFDQVNVGLAAWFPEAQGDFEAHGAQGEMDGSFRDGFSRDRMGAVGRAEFWEGDWGYILGGQYLDTSDTRNVVGGKVQSRLMDQTVDFLVAQRFQMAPASGEKPASTAQISGGMRYRRLDQRVAATPGASQADEHDWIEAVVGGGVTLPTSNSFAFTANADVSGFGIGTGSKRTMTMFAGGAWNLAVSNTLSVGWRHYDVDLTRGTGADRFSIDGSFSGPTLGWTFAF